jgi:VanZ family protein
VSQIGEGAAPLWLRATTIGFAIFLLGLVLLANRGVELLRQVAAFVPGGDKTAHFALMGTMAFLMNLCWRSERWQLGPLPVLKGSALVALIVTLEEFSQLFMIRRSFSFEDLAYDYLGILIFGQIAAWLVWGLTRHSRKQDAASP